MLETLDILNGFFAQGRRFTGNGRKGAKNRCNGCKNLGVNAWSGYSLLPYLGGGRIPTGAAHTQSRCWRIFQHILASGRLRNQCSGSDFCALIGNRGCGCRGFLISPAGGNQIKNSERSETMLEGGVIWWKWGEVLQFAVDTKDPEPVKAAISVNGHSPKDKRISKEVNGLSEKSTEMLRENAAAVWDHLLCTLITSEHQCTETRKESFVMEKQWFWLIVKEYIWPRGKFSLAKTQSRGFWQDVWAFDLLTSGWGTTALEGIQKKYDEMLDDGLKDKIP